MPTYEYERADGTRFDYVQKITDDALTTCPTTGQPVKRLVSAAAFHLKGTGWYKTDYSSSSSGGSSSSSSGSSGGSSSSSSSSTSSGSSSASSSSQDSSGSSGTSGGCGGGCGPGGCKSGD